MKSQTQGVSRPGKVANQEPKIQEKMKVIMMISSLMNYLRKAKIKAKAITKSDLKMISGVQNRWK
jgi:ribosomal protein S30